jgi:hypothetical protein
MDYGSLPGFSVGERQVIVIHPLWNTRNPTGELAHAIAASDDANSISFLDTFNLQRRPARSYESLARNP